MIAPYCPRCPGRPRGSPTTATKLKLAIIGVPLLATITMGAHAETIACTPASPAKVTADITIGEPQIKTDINLDELRTAAQGHRGPLVGAYAGALHYEIQIDDDVTQETGERFCSTPRYVTLVVQVDRIIYIPQEFAADPCLAVLAREHETRHADAEAKALDHARPALLTAIRKALNRATIDPGVSRAAAFAALTKTIGTSVDQAFDDMTVERRRLDAEVDSAVEINRLKTSCAGRAANVQ
jgi:hypothetical protein